MVSIQVYWCELQLGFQTPHFDVEIHDIVEISVPSLLLLEVNALYVNCDRSQFLDICGASALDANRINSRFLPLFLYLGPY